jgi:hypothetical protein
MAAAVLSGRRGTQRYTFADISKLAGAPAEPARV